jgi:hypothetical protein
VSSPGRTTPPLEQIPLGSLPETPWPGAITNTEETLDAANPLAWAKRRVVQVERKARKAYVLWTRTPYAKRTKRAQRASEARQLVVSALLMQALVTEMEVIAEQRTGVVDFSKVPDVPDAQELTRCAWRRMYDDARKRGVAA